MSMVRTSVSAKVPANRVMITAAGSCSLQSRPGFMPVSSFLPNSAWPNTIFPRSNMSPESSGTNASQNPDGSVNTPISYWMPGTMLCRICCICSRVRESFVRLRRMVLSLRRFSPPVVRINLWFFKIFASFRTQKNAHDHQDEIMCVSCACIHFLRSSSLSGVSPGERRDSVRQSPQNL